MKIQFASRSKFLNTCEENIRDQYLQLEKGRSVTFTLCPGGYNGRVRVTLPSATSEETVSMEFDTDWRGNDVSRFPARIKAVATVLRDCGYTGRFIIIHDAGKISIEREL